MRKLKIFAVAALLFLLPLCACGAETPEVIENDFDLPYDMYVEAERAEESLTVKKLDDVPGYIRGDIASISGIVDDNTLLMTVHNTRENYYFGTYDLESGEYTECYAVDRVDGEYCEVAAVGDGYLILYSTNSDWQYASLKYVPLDGGRAKKFFDYSQGFLNKTIILTKIIIRKLILPLKWLNFLTAVLIIFSGYLTAKITIIKIATPL